MKLENFNIDFYTLLATISVTIIGWLVALWTQNRNIKQQHKIQIKYDIYKQFVQIRKDIQDSIIKLGGSTIAPFALMDSNMVPFNLKLQKQYKDTWLPYNEPECVFEGEEKWTSYVQEIRNLYFEFSNKYIMLLGVFEDWAAALNSLMNIRNILYKEVERLRKNIEEQSGVLQIYSSKNGYDWRKWNRKEIEIIADNIKNSSYEIGCYLNDFMILVHNELLTKYFKQKRVIRKTLDSKYKVLTKKGIIENVDYKKVKLMKVYKDKLIKLAEEHLNATEKQILSEDEFFLRSIINGNCPTCSNLIEVYDIKKERDNICFDFICGHRWNTNIK